jgi:plasmid stability protein
MIAMHALRATLHSPYGPNMASLTIRNLDDPLKARLRVQAAVNGRSMEEEARTILRAALDRAPPRAENLAKAIRACFRQSGGADLEPLPREPIREPPTFD